MKDFLRSWRRKAMHKALNYLALARKAGRIELGEEPVGAVARARKARLVVVASDASDHTWRRAVSFVAETDQQCIRAPFNKDELGLAVGRTSLALAAFTDAALALSFLKAMDQPERYQDQIASLDKRAQRIRQRQKEAKAHEKNVRQGKKK